MNKELLKQSIKLWGRDVQINKIQEEALELSLVLNQRNCPTKDPDQMDEQLYDELADMKIMMAQADILFDEDRINERVAYKLNKLKVKYLDPHFGNQLTFDEYCKCEWLTREDTALSLMQFVSKFKKELQSGYNQ